ncbi:MAG TPA: valine--tRNA ligase [Verrucomicrobiae bacterium]|nr:valine--tRNA ligase [Verrucomicrobiae bacterium]
MPATEIPKAYEPKRVEDKWYADWLKKGHFTANPASTKPPYSIVIPPPNVTGVLTMGHVLNNTLQDILARRKRMQGYEVLWLPGTDHAGIATQAVVEKALKKQGVMKHRNDLGREKFLEKVWEWKEKHGGIIIQQLKKLGCSCDWTRERFTMDDQYSRCVLQVFVDLYQKGLIYRGRRMVNWDPAGRTALSDEEVIMTETQGHLWHIKYPFVGSDQFMAVATTRPETMLGDEAVAVHPEDPRYRHLVGKKLLLPLRNKEIPVIADAAVDPKFGTGCVKVTPAHDVADYEMALRHQLPFPVVIAPDGTMTEEAGEEFEGLDRFECREAVVEQLTEQGLLLKVEDHTHNVGYSERTNVPIEPYLSEQWFLRYPQVPRSTDAVEQGAINFYPERWTKTYTHWMRNLRDWCISRQLWWGHRIPVWYRKLEIRNPKSETRPEDVYVGLTPPPDPENWEQDPDVLDTWFSSWLWPFATMEWNIEMTQAGTPVPPILKKFYPTADLVTGPDIIFFWVARMIMAGYEFRDEKPFSNVYFTGIIRDSVGRKMSKSLGNSPDPLDLISKYGADGLRFGLMLIAPQGQDILFDEKRCEVGRNFMNKLWNAARFIQMQRQNQLAQASLPANPTAPQARKPVPPTEYNAHDLKILFEMNEAITKVSAALDNYKFNEAAKELYDFVWGDFCDWYIEASKVLPNIAVLDEAFNTILRLLHPFAPFITEELWADTGGSGTIQFAAWPQPRTIEGATAEHAAKVDELYEIISAARQLRNEYAIPPKQHVEFVVVTERFTAEDCHTMMRLIGNCGVRVTPNYVPHGVTPSLVTKTATVFMVGAVDAEAERKRLTKQLTDIEKQLAATDAKLANDNFVSKAAPIAVQRERDKQQQLREQREKLQALLRQMENG